MEAEFSSFLAASEALRRHEIETNTRYSVYKSTKNFGSIKSTGAVTCAISGFIRHVSGTLKMTKKMFFCPSCEERKSRYGKERKSVDEGLKITQLPFEVLQNIFEEVVLSDGDVAYGKLSHFCSTFNDVCRRKSFKDKCHLSWLLSIRPKSFWEKHRRDFKGFEVVLCRLCGETYKDEGHMFVGGKGQRAMFTASYTEPSGLLFTVL